MQDNKAREIIDISEDNKRASTTELTINVRVIETGNTMCIMVLVGH